MNFLDFFQINKPVKKLSTKLRPEMIVDRVAILISNYKREIEREERTGNSLFRILLRFIQ